MVAFKYNAAGKYLLLVSTHEKIDIVGVPAGYRGKQSKACIDVFFKDSVHSIGVATESYVEAFTALANWKEGDDILDLTVYQGEYMTIKLEPGKYYRTRGGSKAYCVGESPFCLYGRNLFACFIEGVAYARDHIQAYDENGEAFEFLGDSADIIAEWED